MFFKTKIRSLRPQWYKPKIAHHIRKTPQWFLLVGALCFCDATLWQELENPWRREKSTKENVSLSARAPWIEILYIFHQGDDPQHWAKLQWCGFKPVKAQTSVQLSKCAMTQKLLFTNCLHPTWWQLSYFAKRNGQKFQCQDMQRCIETHQRKLPRVYRG